MYAIRSYYALAGAGMLKAVLTVLTTLQWLTVDSGTYHILAAAANAVFYFLPILLGVTAAIKFGANPYIGGTIGAALLEPNFTGLLQTAGQSTSFLGLPVVLMDYSSTVIPVFIAMAIVITSYSIHYTKLYDLMMRFCTCITSAALVTLMPGSDAGMNSSAPSLRLGMNSLPSLPSG